MKRGKLPWDTICEIRTKYADNKYQTSMRKLAKEYNISKSLVFKIIHYDIYKPEDYIN